MQNSFSSAPTVIGAMRERMAGRQMAGHETDRHSACEQTFGLLYGESREGVAGE